LCQSRVKISARNPLIDSDAHGFLFTGGKKSMQNHQHCETLGIAQTRSLRCGGLEQTKESVIRKRSRRG
jgi:hypothetical protein